MKITEQLWGGQHGRAQAFYTWTQTFHLKAHTHNVNNELPLYNITAMKEHPACVVVMRTLQSNGKKLGSTV